MTNYFDQFIGVDTNYPLATGKEQLRIHLDGAASPLVMKAAADAVTSLLPHYSNSHSHSHASARVMSAALNWSIKTILDVTGADDSSNKEYSCVFMGSGSTALLNNVARRLSKRDGKSMVLASAMEHHANDLPHRHHFDVEHFPLLGEFENLADIDLAALEQLLIKHQDKLNYITVSAVSNVTGTVNPIKEITRLAHEYGVYVVLDCAQMAAHMALNIADNDADFVIFSGHKVYAGAAPGVMIAKTELLEKHPSDEMGGGIVEHVSYRDAVFTNQFPARELPGTKNILGIYALAKVLDKLQGFDLETVEKHGKDLWAYAYDKLSALDCLTIYGKSKHPRIGALAFNIDGVDHGLAAAILSDYYGIAVRNECFCAHPYVSALLKNELWSLDLEGLNIDEQESLINRKKGMLRASFSLYNTEEDVDYLCESISGLIKNISELESLYINHGVGDYIHQEFKLDLNSYLL